MSLIPAFRCLAVLVAMICATVQARTIYVSTAGNDASDGLGWGTAKKTVQAGLNAAVSDDQVWVAAGTYVERITLKDGVALYGGFAGSEATLTQRNWTTNKTILDGNQGGTVVTLSQGTAATTRIDGFVIRNGNALSAGGIYCGFHSVIAIANNTITDNSVSNYGGGIMCDSVDAVTIANNTIANNRASSYGGGIICSSAGAPLITGNLIAGNVADAGGGIYCQSMSRPTIANNAILGNIGDPEGGGIYVAMYSSVTIANNTIAGNAASQGGGIYCDYSCSPVIRNTIIALNSSGIFKESGAGSPLLRSSCVYGNGTYNYSGLADATGTDGNINADPQLADVRYGSVHIQPTSPCRDTGDDSSVQANWRDIDGQERIIGSHADIGADESDGTTWSGDPHVIVRVSPTGNDANDGSSWVLAKRTVQAAIDTAAGLGGDVWVKAGTYAERVTLRTFVHIYGGFAGTETTRPQRNWSANASILDGGAAGSVVTAKYLGCGVSTVDGLTLSNGSGTQVSSYRYGGGVYCYYACPMVVNTTILNNSTQHGGGIYCMGFYPVFTNNRIQGNIASSNGAGIYCERSSPLIGNNTIAGNNANSCGGGIYCESSSGAKISSNTITANIGYLGAAIYCDSGSPVIANNLITSNTGSYRGAIRCEYSPAVITNNTIVGNSCIGIDCSNSSPTIANNTVVGNSGDGMRFYAGSPVVTNTIVAFNTFGITCSSSTPVLRYNCVYGNGAGNYSGIADPTGTNGNLSADPRLANSGAAGAHIQPNSPCNDAGDDTAIQPGWTDADGQARTLGAHVDIGADESDGTTWPTGFSTIVRVAPTGNDANTGSTWAQAKRTVQAAIEAATPFGGEVWVKEGTYAERITLRNFVHVYGGFAGTETNRSERNWAARLTILDGSQAGSVVTAKDLGYAVSTIDGFTIRNGSGTLSSGVRRGGGIYCYYASPTIAHNTITGNSVTGSYASGGGIYYYEASPMTTSNLVTGNTAVSGGGIYCDDDSYPTIAGNTVTRNSVAGSSSYAGGIYCDSFAAPVITGTIVAYNSSGIYRASTASTPVLRYNCVYGNTTYNYSNIPDPTGTNGNIAVAPGFVRTPATGPDLKWATADDDAGNLHLLAGSPCVNAGDPAAVPANSGSDIDGQPRKIASRVDIGADESCSLGDINKDGYVNVGDLQLLVAAWGSGPGYTGAADINGDGYVNVGDLQLLVANWAT